MYDSTRGDPEVFNQTVEEEECTMKFGGHTFFTISAWPAKFRKMNGCI